jgi:anti-sigma regulatory factor (Ser/Thr protein kinase)
MDAAVSAERPGRALVDGLLSRAAEARHAASVQRRRSEQACDRSEQAIDHTAAALLGWRGPPFGDRAGRFQLRLGRSRPLVRFVRHDLRRWLERAGLPAGLVSEITLACSEAFANAVEHPRRAARQLVEVEAALEGGELELRVRDFGSWLQRSGSPLRGRGLDMIRALMDSLDLERAPQGTELVMRRSISP